MVSLLRLGEQTDLAPFLADALALAVTTTGAQHAYIEVHDPLHPNDTIWSATHEMSDDHLAGVRSVISRGVIAEALASGGTVATGDAAIDPRFRDRDSVLSAKIRAVICAPICDDPPVGVVYLQGPRDGGGFSTDDVALIEELAKRIAPFADRLLRMHREGRRNDHVDPLRRQLRLDGLVGRAQALASVLQQVALAAPLDVDLLLTGDTGTGKTQLARVIHENSSRRNGPCVELNCAALPESLIESELFGALPGAHSTATHRMEGKVAAADRGTLVLDEIADLPLGAQAKLLHLLQSRQYFPLGSARALSADVRVIAATNENLHAAIAAKRFREDLYYRLHVLPIRLPTLAERSEDISVLAEHFARDACSRYRLRTMTFSPAAVAALENASWPGNVRQLQHVVQAAVIRASGDHGDRIDRAHLFPEQDGSRPAAETYQEATRRFQRELVRKTLEACDWNVIEVASRLDIARSYVYALIRAFGLARETA